MSVEDYMPEARQLAAQCWCDEETSGTVMDVVLAESVARRIATWMDTAAMFSHNADFYRDLVDKVVAELGPLRDKAFIADDGGIHDSPLRLKVPGLVAELAKQAQT